MTVHEEKLEEQPESPKITPSETLISPQPDLDERHPETADLGVETVSLETADKDVDIFFSQEQTRAKIALLFTQFFLILVALAILAPFVVEATSPAVFDNPLETAKSLLTVVASVLGGSFGFIVGFYFKDKE